MKSFIFCFIYLLFSVPALDTVPLQFSSHIDHLAPGSAQPHKPLSRTRSEPLPQSQRALHTHLLQQQHSTQLLERLKQQTHLGKVRASKCTHPSIFTEVCMFRSLVQTCTLLKRRFSWKDSCVKGDFLGKLSSPQI